MNGLVIGKFMPVHAGHMALIAWARPQVDTLHVVLFSKPDEPIAGEVRAEWLGELYPELPLHHVTEAGPVDYADRAAWAFWVAAIRAALGGAAVDVVFSSEPYGPELARRLGARHAAFDPARAQTPVSATQIRTNPLAHWRHIPLPARPYFARRVAIVGAESTGKTTLAQALAKRFGTMWVPEFARDYLLARGGVCVEADMLVIAAGQADAEDRQARAGNGLLICDTNCLTTQLWYEHYFGAPPEALRRLARERTAHLYLLCDHDVPWVPDGLRDSPAERGWFHARFVEELAAQELPYVTLSGPFAKRLEPAVAAVERLLARKA
ncbi:MAG: AAA family ATPase [Anaerolineales bacterium]|nr:AAA family ATPase [Anaerolineales bacterium]